MVGACSLTETGNKLITEFHLHGREEGKKGMRERGSEGRREGERKDEGRKK
jgi:hypothetical protein